MIAKVCKLESFLCLERLSLAANALRDFPFAAVARMPRIKFIDVAQNYLSVSSNADQRVTGLADQKTPTEVVPSLFVGAVSCSGDVAELKHLGIDHVLSVGVPPQVTASKITYKQVALGDMVTADLLGVLPEACDFIDAALAKRDSRVLVHCHAGQSRSAAVVVAWLIRARRMPYADALALLLGKRTCAAPNPGFQEQLKRWAAGLGV
eukprot:TRINITY_DN1627_c0_g1_i1.p1 TRINITY_DN1627_c0_g1~~TRINITY_DN1627_c0_g1_i1.p1  ORF type:complete len:208 (+),score=61.21 TRINITY_DN1627_c0_g1_i1:594-1217(+)